MPRMYIDFLSIVDYIMPCIGTAILTLKSPTLFVDCRLTAEKNTYIHIHIHNISIYLFRSIAYCM